MQFESVIPDSGLQDSDSCCLYSISLTGKSFKLGLPSDDNQLNESTVSYKEYS